MDLRQYWNPATFPVEKEFLEPYDVTVGFHGLDLISCYSCFAGAAAPKRPTWTKGDLPPLLLLRLSGERCKAGEEARRDQGSLRLQVGSMAACANV